MAPTTPLAFDEFKNRLKLTSAQQEAVTARRDATAGYAKQAFPPTSELPVGSTELIGSAGRGTIIRPLDDVDLLVVFGNKDGIFERYRHDSRLFLYRVRDALNSYSRVEVVGARGQAVRFFYVEAPHVDVAPVFRWNDGGYILPNGTGGWLRTDPIEHAAYMSRRNDELGMKLKSFVQMAKQWNRAHSKYFKSFHLEMLAAACFTSIGGDSRVAFRLFFEWAQSHLAVTDPAGYAGDLSTYLTPTQRQNARNNLETARVRAVNAIAAETRGDHKESIRLWQLTFGSEFPAYN